MWIAATIAVLQLAFHLSLAADEPPIRASHRLRAMGEHGLSVASFAASPLTLAQAELLLDTLGDAPPDATTRRDVEVAAAGPVDYAAIADSAIRRACAVADISPQATRRLIESAEVERAGLPASWTPTNVGSGMQSLLAQALVAEKRSARLGRELPVATAAELARVRATRAVVQSEAAAAARTAAMRHLADTTP